MSYTQFGPGDSATWPAYAGHPNDPRYNGEDEDNLEGAMVELEGNTIDVLYERVGNRAVLRTVSFYNVDLSAACFNPHTVRYLESQIERNF